MHRKRGNTRGTRSHLDKHEPTRRLDMIRAFPSPPPVCHNFTTPWDRADPSCTEMPPTYSQAVHGETVPWSYHSTTGLWSTWPYPAPRGTGPNAPPDSSSPGPGGGLPRSSRSSSGTVSLSSVSVRHPIATTAAINKLLNKNTRW